MIKTIPAVAERKYFVCNSCNKNGGAVQGRQTPLGWSALEFQTGEMTHCWGQDPREEPSTPVITLVHLCPECVKKLVREKRWV